MQINKMADLQEIIFLCLFAMTKVHYVFICPNATVSVQIMQYADMPSWHDAFELCWSFEL
jgi:hypothetical protein